MKTIVTHFSPDVDATASVWLLKRFLPEWNEAELAFCPAGKTLNNAIVDSDPDIIHVDTGMGILDHHQTGEDTCAAVLTMKYIATQRSNSNPSISLRARVQSSKINGKNHNSFPDEGLERLIDVVNDIDHFREVYFPNPNADFYDFSLVAQMDGWKLLFPDQHHKLIEMGMNALDGIYRTFQNKVWAQTEIKKNGIEFETRWGKGMGIETLNDEAVRVAQRMGYIIAVRKDPKKDYVRIKAQPESKADLTICYNTCRKKDPDATWFLHAGKKMLLNGSIKNPESKPTKLTLRELMEIIKKS
jgi:hypothetical protein